MTKTLFGILAIAILGQIAGAIDGSIREVSLSAAPAAAPGEPPANMNARAEADGDAGATEPQTVELGFFIDIPQAKTLFEAGDAVFADARPLDQYEEGHIVGSEHLDPNLFFGGEDPDFVYIYPIEQRIVIYCQGGQCDASELVAIRLQGFGYSNLHILKPGYPAWVEAGLPTEAGQP